MKKDYSLKSEKGQLLIELLVTLAIGAIIIGSIVSLGNTSTSRSSLARQQNEATKLALEGAEIVRHVAEADRPGSVSIAGVNSWSDLYASPVGSVSGRLVRCGGNWCIHSGTETIFNLFRRNITITDNNLSGSTEICADTAPPPSADVSYNTVKRVTVRVAWSAPSGQQHRDVVTCMTNKSR